MDANIGCIDADMAQGAYCLRLLGKQIACEADEAILVEVTAELEKITMSGL